MEVDPAVTHTPEHVEIQDAPVRRPPLDEPDGIERRNRYSSEDGDVKNSFNEGDRNKYSFDNIGEPPLVSRWKTIKEVKSMRSQCKELDSYYKRLEDWAGKAFCDAKQVREDVHQFQRIVGLDRAYVWTTQLITHPIQIRVAKKSFKLNGRSVLVPLPAIVAALDDCHVLALMLEKLYFADDNSTELYDRSRGKLKFQSAHYTQLTLSLIDGLGVSDLQLRQKKSILMGSVKKLWRNFGSRRELGDWKQLQKKFDQFVAVWKKSFPEIDDGSRC